MAQRPKPHGYWRRVQRLTALLAGVWFAVSFVVAYFARELSFDFFGWPFGWWVAAQGALMVYVAIVGIYAFCMHRLDVEHGVAEED